MKKTISVLIPTKDREENLLRCITHISGQEYKPLEVIIIDDGDINDSFLLELKNILKLHYIDLVYINKKNSGYKKGSATSYNIGFSISKGDIVSILDDDVYIESDYLLEIIKAFESNKKIYGVGGIITNEIGRKKGLLEYMKIAPSRIGMVNSFGFTRQYDFSQINGIFKIDWIGSGASNWKKEIFQEFNFDDYFYSGYSLGQDLEFSYRVSRKYLIVMNSNAKGYHDHKSTGRPNYFRMGIMETYNHKYFVKKNLKYISRFVFYFAMWILIINKIFKGILRFNINDFKNVGGRIIGLFKRVQLNKVLIISSGVYSTPPKDGDAVSKFTYDLSMHLAEDDRNLKYCIFDVQDDFHPEKYDALQENLEIIRYKIPKFIIGKYKYIYFYGLACFYARIKGYRLIITSNQWGVFWSKVFLKKNIFVSHYYWGESQRLKGEKLATRLSNIPIAISPHIYEQMLILNKNVKLIQNGVDTEKYSFGNNSYRIDSILYVGKIWDLKRVKDLVIAFHNLQFNKKISSGFRLDIVGPLSSQFGGNDTGYYEEIKDYIDSNNIQNIIFHGAKGENELIHFYQTSKVFVLPSRNEGLPLVLLESMSCGLPVISNSFPGIEKNFSKESGVITYKYCDIDDLTRTLEYVCNINNEEYLKLSNQVREYIDRNFSYIQKAKEYSEIIKDYTL